MKYANTFWGYTWLTMKKRELSHLSWIFANDNDHNKRISKIKIKKNS